MFYFLTNGTQQGSLLVLLHLAELAGVGLAAFLIMLFIRLLRVQDTKMGIFLVIYSFLCLISFIVFFASGDFGGGVVFFGIGLVLRAISKKYSLNHPTLVDVNQHPEFYGYPPKEKVG